MKSNNKSTQIKQNYSIIKYIFQLFQLLNISIKMHSHLGCKTSQQKRKASWRERTGERRNGWFCVSSLGEILPFQCAS